MTDNPSPGVSGPGEPDDAAPRPAPWFPPSAEPGGYTPPPPPPPPGAPAPGTAQPSPNGAPGGYHPGYGQPGGYSQRGGYPPYPGGGYGPSGQSGWQSRTQAPKPGVIPLRPLGVGEILDGAFTSIRRNPRATLGITATAVTIAVVITTVFAKIMVHYLGTVNLPSVSQHLTTRQYNHLLELLGPIGGVDSVFAFLVITLLTGMLALIIGRSVLGQQVTLDELWRLTRPRLAALIGTALLILLIFVGIWAVYLLVLVILAAFGGGSAGVALLGLIAAGVIATWIAVMLVTSASVTVLEHKPPARALARSWRLVSGSFWRVFGITLLAGIIAVVTYKVLQIPFGVIADAVGGGSLFVGNGGSLAGTFVGAAGQIVAGTVAAPIYSGVAVLLYMDLRMRREGLDLVLQTATADGREPTGDEFMSMWRPGSPAAPMSEGAPPGTPPAW